MSGSTCWKRLDDLRSARRVFRLERHLGSLVLTVSSQWKGVATYHNFLPPDGTPTVSNRVWSYPSPNANTKFQILAGYLSFYASSNTETAGWECYVDGEKVVPQEGDVRDSFQPVVVTDELTYAYMHYQFYGGWITSEIEGKMKGGPGTRGW